MTPEQAIGIGTCCCGGLTFRAIGVLFGIAALESRLFDRTFRRDAVRGSGVVTGQETEDSGEGGARYHLIVAYTDQSGAAHAATVGIDGRRRYKVGQAINILHLPVGPSAVQIVGFHPERMNAGLSVMFFLGGGASAAIGAANWVFRIPVNRG